MVTPSEGFVVGMLFGGFVKTGFIPNVFALVMRWCVRGAKLVFVGAVGVDEIWVICVRVDGTWSTVSPNIFANFC